MSLSVIDEAGRWTPVEVTPGVLSQLGRRTVFHGLKVIARGSGPSRQSGAELAVRSAEPDVYFRISSITREHTFQSLQATPQLGRKPYVTLLCKFSDLNQEPFSLGTIERWMGASPGGMQHYYSEMSAAQLSLAGSLERGWYRLSKPSTYYYPDGLGGALRGQELIDDCTALAADVDFSAVAGINIQHNAAGFFGFGGQAFLRRDGPNRVVGATWNPTGADPVLYAHEIGHSLGWPHSQYSSSTFCTPWDVMSCGDLVYTIAPHLRDAGWIPPGRRLEPSLPSRRSMILVRPGTAPNAPGFQTLELARRTLAGSSYVFEARRRHGDYESRLPADAVIIHTVDRTRPEWAWFVDVDHNDNPADQAAVWSPGETFADSVDGITLAVDSVTASGFGVTVTRGWLLTITSIGSGKVTTAGSEDCSETCHRVLETRGSVVALAAVPAPGSVFAGWEGDCSGQGPCSVTLNGNRQVNARFTSLIVITSPSTLPEGVTGVRYNERLSVDGGDGSLRWALASGALPEGLTLDRSAGVLDGSPVTAGTFRFTVEASTTASRAHKEFTLKVVAPLTITSDAIRPQGTVGLPYEDRLEATGGSGVFAWSLSSGTLPREVDLNQSNGRISGVPSIAGHYRFVINASSGSLTDEQAFEVTILSDVITSSRDLPAAIMGAVYTHQLTTITLPSLVTWSVRDGSLPPGVNFDSRTGMFSGVPEAAGEYSFVVEVSSGAVNGTLEVSLRVTKPSLEMAMLIDQLLLDRTTLSADELRFLDLLGNRNRRFDVGDLRAWLLDNGSVGGPLDLGQERPDAR